MSVSLTPRTEDQIRRWVDSGQYADADAVVVDALQLLEERNRARFQRLRELVRVGFESGDGVELTTELWDELEREAEEAYERGEQPDPDVCP